MSRPPNPGEMGSLPDVLTVAMGAGGALTVLVSALRTWLAQPRRSDVKITVRSPDGRVVELDAHRVADSEALLRAVLEAAPAATLSPTPAPLPSPTPVPSPAPELPPSPAIGISPAPALLPAEPGDR